MPAFHLAENFHLGMGAGTEGKKYTGKHLEKKGGLHPQKRDRKSDLEGGNRATLNIRGTFCPASGPCSLRLGEAGLQRICLYTLGLLLKH